VPAETSLPAIDGVDTADGLARVAGNARLYRSLLAQFAERQGDAAGAVAQALARGDRDAATLAAHTVKGVAGNLGMRRLHAAAETLERALRAGGAVPAEATGEFASLLAGQVEAVRHALGAERATTGNPPRPSPAPFDAQAARAAIQRLRELLAASDGDAGSAFASLSEALAGTVARPRLDALERSIDEFDFDGALSKLDAISRECETIRTQTRTRTEEPV
jgi:two-component system sensor histidine kinase/response regulator